MGVKVDIGHQKNFLVAWGQLAQSDTIVKEYFFLHFTHKVVNIWLHKC